MDVAAQPGRGISRDIGRGEAIEHDLDALITRRHDQRVQDEGHRPREELWAASERAYFARRDEDRCLERLTEWVSENSRYQEGFAAKALPELDALAEPTGTDA